MLARHGGMASGSGDDVVAGASKSQVWAVSIWLMAGGLDWLIWLVEWLGKLKLGL